MLSLFILVSFVLSLVYAAGDPALIAKRCLLPEADEPAPICGGGPRPTQTASSASTVQSYTVNDPEKYPNEISVKITVPNELDDKAYNAALLDNLKSNLPNTLQQLQVDPAQIPALAEEGLPLLLEAITAVQNGSSLSDDPGSETARARRGLFSKIGKWIKKVVSAIVKAVQEAIKDLECSAFAALTLPGFMVSDAAFTILNIGGTGVPTTKDQDYFIDPLHGSVSHDDGVSIYYNARFAPGFGSAAATTFGRRIYMRADNSATIASPPLVQQSGFQQRTKTLLHEFTHVKQYKALFYDESSFGLRYLFAYCKVCSSAPCLLSLPFPKP